MTIVTLNFNQLLIIIIINILAFIILELLKPFITNKFKDSSEKFWLYKF